MTQPLWLQAVTRRDPSVPLTLAAVVRGAGVWGALSLVDLQMAYRETFLVCYRNTPRGAEADLSEHEVREHLVGSLLPRLSDEGWIDDTSAVGWEAIQAVGDWWPAAAGSRSGSFDMLVDIARRASQTTARPARTRR